MDFDFRPLGGHFVTDQIFDVFSRFFGARARVRRFTRCVDALPGVWMLYQVCGCFTRCVDVLPGVWMLYQESFGRAGSRAKHSCGTAAARRAQKTVSHERGRGTAAARRQKKLLFTVPFWWVGQVVIRYQIQISRFARETCRMKRDIAT